MYPSTAKTDAAACATANAKTAPATPSANVQAVQVGAALHDMHLLMVLGETQSYTQAAQRLGLSKATVSQALRRWSVTLASAWCNARPVRWP